MNDTYFKTYTAAIDFALNMAKGKGYTINDEDIWNEITIGPKRPANGHTNNLRLPLYKNGKEVKHMLIISVYGMTNSFELNTYIS